MNRRHFIRCSATGGLVLSAAPAAMISGCSTDWVSVIEKDIPIVVGIANAILSVIATATGNGAIASTVGGAITLAVNGLTAALNALQDAINAYAANKANGLSAVIAAISAAQQDATQVMAALPAGTISATWQMVVIAGLGTVVTILSSIQAMVPGAAPASVTAQAAATAAKGNIVLPSSDALKAGFNAVLALKGYASAEIK